MFHRFNRPDRTAAFTLMEMSIVLVVIGLVIGGLLVGQDLVSASQVRAQIVQIQKYQMAVNAFKNKFNALPGDLPKPLATLYGFQARAGWVGEGDGNNVIEGNTSAYGPLNSGTVEGGGETAVFWQDLGSDAGGHLIEGSFPMAYMSHTPYDGPYYGSMIGLLMPEAKIGGGNYIGAWSGGYWVNNGTGGDGVNYYSLSYIQYVNSSVEANAGITVRQAYDIDKKMDDGLPQSGNVMAFYPSFGNSLWAPWAAFGNYNTTGQAGAYDHTTYGPSTAWTAATSKTCYDNRSTGGAVMQYSTLTNYGMGLNCGLSFRFQ